MNGQEVVQLLSLFIAWWRASIACTSPDVSQLPRKEGGEHHRLNLGHSTTHINPFIHSNGISQWNILLLKCRVTCGSNSRMRGRAFSYQASLLWNWLPGWVQEASVYYWGFSLNPSFLIKPDWLRWAWTIPLLCCWRMMLLGNFPWCTEHISSPLPLHTFVCHSCMLLT